MHELGKGTVSAIRLWKDTDRVRTYRDWKDFPGCEGDMLADITELAGRIKELSSEKVAKIRSNKISGKIVGRRGGSYIKFVDHGKVAKLKGSLNQHGVSAGLKATDLVLTTADLFPSQTMIHTVRGLACAELIEEHEIDEVHTTILERNMADKTLLSDLDEFFGIWAVKQQVHFPPDAVKDLMGKKLATHIIENFVNFRAPSRASHDKKEHIDDLAGEVGAMHDEETAKVRARRGTRGGRGRNSSRDSSGGKSNQWTGKGGKSHWNDKGGKQQKGKGKQPKGKGKQDQWTNQNQGQWHKKDDWKKKGDRKNNDTWSGDNTWSGGNNTWPAGGDAWSGGANNWSSDNWSSGGWNNGGW
jgi:hypothetical protein